MAKRTVTKQAKELLSHLPVRKKHANKSHGGRLWVVAGSLRYPGAAILASRAASRMGAGYVGLSILGLPKGHAPFWMKSPDFIALPATLKTLKDFRPSAVAIGPGIGRTLKAQQTARRLINELKRHREVAVVIDADGLRVLANTPLPAHWILTPHSGELAMLLGWSVKRVDSDRRAAVSEAQKKFKCIIVLKGYETLLADSDRKMGGTSIFKNTTGNSALAKAGTGDVLTGMIAGLLAQSVEPLLAARLAVWLHGKLADRWVKSGRDQLSLMASDLLDDLPFALKSMRPRS